MIFRNSAWLLTSMLVACGSRSEPSPAPAVTAPPAASPAPTPAPVPSEPAAPAVAPAPVPPPSTPAALSTPSTPASTEPDDKTLERSPGLTPPVPLVRAPAPKAAKDLQGTPGESPAMGPNDALVKVFVFSDFQCPVCRRAVEPLKKLARAYPEDVQILFKHHALSSHPRAEPAARASMAAFRQGRFWEFHDRAFEAQRSLEDDQLAAHAQALGLDMAVYAKDLADPAIAAQIAYEGAQARALDGQGTPAFFINGDKTVGWGSYLGVESQVRRALDDAKALLASGVPRAEVAKKATAAKDAAAASILFGD